MNKKQPTIKECLQLVTIIALGVFFLVGNNIPVQALHKEEAALNKFDNLKQFADAVQKGDQAKIIKNDIPLLSMKASDIYKHANAQTKDCIDLAAKMGNSLADNEVVHCVNDVNFFKNKASNSSVPTTTTTTTTSSPITSTSADTGNGGTSTPTSDTSTPTSDTSTSSSGDVKENIMINELVKTGKFTENEAKDFVTKTMQNGGDVVSTSNAPTTSNTDTNTKDTQSSNDQNNNANTQTSNNQANTQQLSSQNNNANTQTSNDQSNNANTQTSNNQANTQQLSSQNNNNNTQTSNNQANNNQSSNVNSNKAIDYNNLKNLVHNIKNHVVDSDDISLNAFQDSGAYKGADQATQKCIDLAGKIGKNLGDQEIVHCSEDSSFYQNQISSNTNNANTNNTNNANNNANTNKNSGDTGN